jgi:SSS family solute:Na+ symporter
LNSCVTLFGIDIYKQFINKDAAESQVVSKGKQFGIGLAIFAMVLAPFLYYASSGLFGYLQEVNGAYSVPILTAIVVGFLSKRVPAIAAKAGIIFAFVVYVTYIILSRGFEVDWLPHMLDMQAITFVLTVALMLIIRLVNPRGTAYEQKYTNEVDITTWKYVKPVGVVITLVVISTYIIFR